MAAAPQPPSPIAALYLQSVALPLSSLAAANDNEAKAVCDSLRTALSSSQLNTLNINAVTAAAESLQSTMRRELGLVGSDAAVFGTGLA